MKTKFLLKQLEKLFEDKVVIVLSEEDLDDLVTAAVPTLREELEESTWGYAGVIDKDITRRERRLKRLVKELEAMPRAGITVIGDDRH